VRKMKMLKREQDLKKQLEREKLTKMIMEANQ
jgi:hypothetical protein